MSEELLIKIERHLARLVEIFERDVDIEEPLPQHRLSDFTEKFKDEDVENDPPPPLPFLKLQPKV